MDFKGRVISYLRDARYCIGFLEDYKFPEKVDYDKIHWLDVNGYRDGWFADPFILSADSKTIVVLAEEWYYPINYGRISRLTISRDGYRLLDVSPVLQLDTHLSFPYFVRENGKIYICPENEQSGNVIIYEYDADANGLVNPVILINEPLMDVQIFNVGEVYYLNGVEYVTGEQDDTRTLQIFTSKKLLGPYSLSQTIVSDHCDKRGAGLAFTDAKGQLIRPSQCCDNNEYGTAVIFNVLTVENGQVAEKEIARISRNRHRRNGIVLHTFNQCAGNQSDVAPEALTVIDGWDYKHPFMGRLVERIRKVVRKYLLPVKS